MLNEIEDGIRIYRDLRNSRSGGNDVKRLLARDRVPMPIPEGANQRWSMDFVSDQLATGRRFRVLNVVDDYSRECIGQIVDILDSLGNASVDSWIESCWIAPCQPFSIAGVSKKNALGRKHGFACEAQGTLFFDVARIISHHRPSVFLLENVKNLVSHDKGNTFRVIKKILEEDLCYHIDWRVINAKGFVPQNRERIFIAGFRKDTGFDFSQLAVPDPEDGPVMSMVLHSEDGSEAVEEPPYTNGPKGEVNPKYTLSEKLWTYLKNYAAKHKAKGNGFGYGLVSPNDVARTLSARYYKDGSEILVWQHGKRPRRLTPRECARLMGFDGPRRPRFEIPVSDTQSYKQFGNAVVIPVVEAVAQFMLPYIRSVINSDERQIVLDLQFAPKLKKKSR